MCICINCKWVDRCITYHDVENNHGVDHICDLPDFKAKKPFIHVVIHSTDNSFGFGYRKNNDLESDELFIKKFDNDLCNNLINDLNKFISKENLQKINKLSVSIGPANFNASRLIVVLARTISQQINCPLDSFSSFEIMAKRIASKNNILKNKKSFWIRT